MKTYSFSVEADYTHTGKDFIDSIRNEIESEKNQLDLTYRINRETTKMHRQILEDLVDEINATLVPIGLKFGNISTLTDSNGYSGHYAFCSFPYTNQTYGILINAHSENGFKDSMYCTYTGDYHLRVGTVVNANVSHLICDRGRSFKTIDELFNNLRDAIKTHLKANS